MPSLSPTLGIKDTARNVGEFVRDNKQVLWNIVKPLAPWLVGLYAIDIIVTHLYFSDSKNGFVLGSILSNYFYTALVISWHRVVIHGAENAIPMNPFKPQKHELVFLGMGLLLGITAVAVGIFAGISFIINPFLGFIIFTAAIIAITYYFYRLSFYFPAKAVNNSITLKQAYSLTPGYFWKLMLSSLIASAKYILGLILLLILIVVTVFIASFIAQQNIEGTIGIAIIELLFSVPVLLYFNPLLVAIGVSALSNYYLYALQNKS